MFKFVFFLFYLETSFISSFALIRCLPFRSGVYGQAFGCSVSALRPGVQAAGHRKIVRHSVEKTESRDFSFLSRRRSGAFKTAQQHRGPRGDILSVKAGRNVLGPAVLRARFFAPTMKNLYSMGFRNPLPIACSGCG